MCEHRDFIFYCNHLSSRFPLIFRYKVTEGSAGGKRCCTWLHGKRPAAFRNLCQIGHSVRFPLATFAFWHLFPPWGRYRKTSRKREAARLQTKGKRIELMAIILKDRQEKETLYGSVYELTLCWNREAIRRCCCGMTPGLAHIRKDGKNFATIDCCSSMLGFVVESFRLAMRPVEWRVVFKDKDINTIPFMQILKSLPL